MKNLLLLVVLALTFMSCEKDDSNETPAPTVYEIEGKWLLENAGGSELLPNTMFEFQNEIKYTYYCVDAGSCDWAGMTTNEAIPSQPQYTFEDNTLTIGDDIVYNVEFACDGAVVNIIFDDSIWSWWRIGTDLDTCN